MRCTIVIIAYQDMELALQCRELVIQTTAPWEQDIILHDNTERNENIHVLWNRFLRSCKNDFFCVLNPDTKPVPLWLHRLVDLLERFPTFGAVGPSTDHCYNEQSGRHPAIVGTAKNCYVPGVLIPGFCAVYRTPFIQELGGWRENFEFYGGDIDLAQRLRLAGHETAWCVPAFVWHQWGQSAKKLGKEKYNRLREQGNRQLRLAAEQYSAKGAGVWKHIGGGNVEWLAH